MQDLAFMVDITQHLNNLNKCKAAKDLSHSIKTPHVHSSWSCPCGRQLSGDDTAHFLCLKSVRATGLNSDLNQYSDKITELLQEFKQRFQIFGKLKMDFQVFC